MPYCTVTHLGYEYGAANVQAWADTDGDADATKITNCIDWHIANEDTYIDDRLRRSNLNYQVPFTTVPTTIRKISVLLTGYALAKARGIRDYDDKGKPISKYWMDRLEAIGLLEQVAEGKLKLEGYT